MRARVYRLAHQWAVSLVLITLVASGARAQAVVSGARAPEIDLPALTGDRVKLSALHGHPVVVTFWGTYCPPCRDEFPILVKAQQAYAAAGLRVLGVNGRDQEFSTKDVQKFVHEFAATFTIALDVRGKARRDFLVLGLPTTVFIDTSGVIRGIHRGPIDRAGLDAGMAAILPPPPEHDPRDG